MPNFISQKRSQVVSPLISGLSDLLYPELTGEIRRCLYEVHGELGPGFWHRMYREAAKVEFEMSGLPCEHKLWMDIYPCSPTRSPFRLLPAFLNLPTR